MGIMNNKFRGCSQNTPQYVVIVLALVGVSAQDDQVRTIAMNELSCRSYFPVKLSANVSWITA